MPRITQTDINNLVSTINNRLKDKGIDLEYYNSPRNGYQNIDIKTKNGYRDGISATTPKEIYGKLVAMNYLLCEIYG